VTTLSVGGALDGADTPESADKPPLDRIGDWGARLGLSSLVADGVLLHGGVSRRSRFPSLRELYSGALGRFEPNPALRPETLLGSEVGVTATRRGAEVQVVGFHHRLTDGIVRRTIPGNGGPSRFQRVNQDEVRSTGLEFLIVGSLGMTTVNGDLTLQKVRGLESDGTQVPLEYEPAVSGKMGMNAPVPGDMRLGGEAHFRGTQQCLNPETDALQPLASSTSFDATLRRLFSWGGRGALRRIDATAALRNLTDATVFDQCGLPQPGRLIQIQFRIW
jgi:iron complex outermembrane receptor protein